MLQNSCSQFIEVLEYANLLKHYNFCLWKEFFLFLTRYIHIIALVFSWYWTCILTGGGASSPANNDPGGVPSASFTATREWLLLLCQCWHDLWHSCLRKGLHQFLTSGGYDCFLGDIWWICLCWSERYVFPIELHFINSRLFNDMNHNWVDSTNSWVHGSWVSV